MPQPARSGFPRGAGRAPPSSGAQARGKWILARLERGWLLLNLGMGGEILLTAPDALPEKRRLVFLFNGGDCLSINFWWFG